MTNEADAQNATATEQTNMAGLAASIPEVSEQTGSESAGKTGEQQKTGLPGSMEEMQTYFQSQKTQMDAMRETVENATNTLSQVADRENKRILNEAVDNAVAKINEGVEGNADLADTFLNHVYQNNPDFKKIFDSRDAAPKALDSALDILKEEWKAMNEKQIDPQVAENQRALQESQKAGGSAAAGAEDPSARFEKMSDGEFLREMQRLAAGA